MKHSVRYLSSHPFKTSLAAIDLMHKAANAFPKHPKKFLAYQIAFTQALENAMTFDPPYDPTETIIYKDENTSVLHTAHLIAQKDPRLNIFEKITEATFPEQVAVSSMVDEQYAAPIKEEFKNTGATIIKLGERMDNDNAAWMKNMSDDELASLDDKDAYGSLGGTGPRP